VAHNCREFPVPPEVLWDLLIDPYTYPDWLVGAEEIRDVDDDWPAVGARFHHEVGVGPLEIPDHSEVLHIEPRRELRLTVRARPFVSAVATFRLVGDRAVSMLSVQEEPTVRTVGNLVRPVMDPSIHLRNHRSLRRLAAVVERHPVR
jgi:uncharacterized protein YndB with AHSA1/START domain